MTAKVICAADKNKTILISLFAVFKDKICMDYLLKLFDYFHKEDIPLKFVQEQIKN